MFAKTLAALGVVGIGLGLHAAAPFTIVSYKLRHGACNESSKVDQPTACAKLLGEGYVATFGKAIDLSGAEVEVK